MKKIREVTVLAMLAGLATLPSFAAGFSPRRDAPATRQALASPACARALAPADTPPAPSFLINLTCGGCSEGCSGKRLGDSCGLGGMRCAAEGRCSDNTWFCTCQTP